MDCFFAKNSYLSACETLRVCLFTFLLLPQLPASCSENTQLVPVTFLTKAFARYMAWLPDACTAILSPTSSTELSLQSQQRTVFLIQRPWHSALLAQSSTEGGNHLRECSCCSSSLVGLAFIWVQSQSSPFVCSPKAATSLL
jgi:hypothetical protein